jgi:hypothetical protein
MSLNKTRKRLIKKCRKYSSGQFVGLKIKLDSGYWSLVGRSVESYIPDASFIKAGSLDASKLSVGGLYPKEFEVTLTQDFSNEEFKKFKGILW